MHGSTRPFVRWVTSTAAATSGLSPDPAAAYFCLLRMSRASSSGSSAVPVLKGVVTFACPRRKWLEDDAHPERRGDFSQGFPSWGSDDLVATIAFEMRPYNAESGGPPT